jgi:methionine-rich copper-binding protein CopC
VRLSAAAASLALAALAVLGVAGPASAHDQLLSTTPKDGSVVDALPSEVTLTFSDLVTDAGGEANQVRVLDSSCRPLDDGAAVIQDNVVVQKLSGQATGPVTVQWRVVSRDGHPVSGEFSFRVGGDAAAASPSCEAAATAPGEADSQGASPAVWIIGGVVVLVVVAGLGYLLVTRSRRTDDQ